MNIIFILTFFFVLLVIFIFFIVLDLSIALEHVLMLLLCVHCKLLLLVTIIIFILHICVFTIALNLGLLLSFFLDSIKRFLGFLFSLPFLLETLGVFSERKRVHRCILLDKDDSVVEVLVHKANTKWGVSIDVFALKLCCTLHNVHGTN